MRCERAVTLLATGGVLGRWLARRHAARCPSCAAEAARLRRIARELSVVEPLVGRAARPVDIRRAASLDRRPPGRPGIAASVLAGPTAAVLLAVVIVRDDRGAGRRRAGTADAGPPSRRSPGSPTSPGRRRRPTIRELDDLKSKFQALARDVAQLRRRAELLDERRDAEALSRRFNRTVALNVP